MNDPNPGGLQELLLMLDGGGAPVDPVRVVVALGVAFAVAAWIAVVYRLAFRGALFTRSFAVALVGASLVTTLVIIPISSNITLSLGMVGALSIVRFRAAIKDPLDIVFMFWAIAVGVATGAGFFGVSVVGSALIGVLLLLAGAVPVGRGEALLLVVRYATGADSAVQAQLPRHRLRSRAQDREGVELVAEVRSEDPALLDGLLAIEGVSDAQLVRAGLD